MKLYCEACQRIGPVGAWSVIEGVLRVACAACGAEAALAYRPEGTPPPANVFAGAPSALRAAAEAGRASAAASPGDEAATSAGAAGRAGAAARPSDPAAPAVASRPPAPASLAASEADAALAAVAGEETIDDEPWLAIGWATLRGQWNDPAAHRRLLAEAAARGDFAGLGARYRDHLARHPDDVVARAARDELLQKATAQLFSRLPLEAGGVRPEQARSWRNALLVLFLVGAFLAAGWMLVQIGGAP